MAREATKETTQRVKVARRRELESRGYLGLKSGFEPPDLDRPRARQAAAAAASESTGTMRLGQARRGLGPLAFGLWRVRFPPVLVRTGRRLPVQALGERRVLVSVTGYPRGGPLGGVPVLGRPAGRGKNK